jgi:hypothetical protein
MFYILPESKDAFISLQGLVNKNNGFWRSAKQARFAPRHFNVRTDYDFCEERFGFRAPEGSKIVTVDTMNEFAHYGSASKVPGLIFFVLDEYGVVAKYKVGGNGNLRDGWAPNPSKCKVDFERDESLELPNFNKDYADMDAAEKAKADRMAARPALEAGRRKLRGKILSTKSVYQNYGYHGGYALKAVIELEDGNRVYGTVPERNRKRRPRHRARVCCQGNGVGRRQPLWFLQPPDQGNGTGVRISK